MFEKQVMLDLIEGAVLERGRIAIRARGKSMLPLIKRGDRLWIERCRPENARVGDVGLFRTDNYFILHRIHRVEREEEHAVPLVFVVKGDSKENFDAPFHAGNFVARVVQFGDGRVKPRLWSFLNQCMIFLTCRGEGPLRKSLKIALSGIVSLLVGARGFFSRLGL